MCVFPPYFKRFFVCKNVIFDLVFVVDSKFRVYNIGPMFQMVNTSILHIRSPSRCLKTIMFACEFDHIIIH